MVRAPVPEFKRICDKWIDDTRGSMAANIPQTLYHYTDAAGLLGMLRNGKVWATGFQFLNDKTEVEYTRARVQDLVRKKARESENPLLSTWYDRIEHYQNSEAPYDFFIFSMSEERDDLSQWRGYAREGQGFTLGLCGQSINQLARSGKNEIGFVRVEYDHDRQMEPIVQALAEFEAALLRLTSVAGSDIAALCDRCAFDFDFVTECRSVANKHRSFRSEKEWRVVTAAHRRVDKDKILTRSSGLRLVNYVELALQEGSEPRLPLKEIGIGPGFTGAEEAHAVTAVCDQNGYVAKPYAADTPYRRV